MRRKGFWLVGILAGLLAGCGSEKKVAEKKGAEGPAVAVVVAPVEQKTVPIYEEFTGRTDAIETVEIRARVAAFLEQQHFQEGTPVKAGQLLFTLDKREYAAQLLSAKAQLSKAQADLNFAVNKATVDASKAQVDVAVANLNKADQDVKRLKPLAEAQAVPQQDYDDALARQKAAIAQMDAAKANLSTTEVNQTSSVEQARAAVEAAKAAVAQAELNLGYCSITSPIDGLIGKREVAPGNLVGKGEPTLLATVSRLNPIRVMVAVSEAEYLKFARERAMKGASNRPLDLVLADGTPFPNKGHVVVADRAVDLKTGTLSLIAEFANPAGLIRPGQFGRVRAAVSMMENALLVPQKAVTEIQSAKIVYVVGSDNKVALRSVELGPRVDEFYVITEGVKAGERVVVEGIQKVRPGAAVQPTNQPVSKESAAK